MQFDLNDNTNSVSLHGDYLWPNELTSFRDSNGDTILLIPDGFLLPGQNDGGLHAMRNPYSSKSRPVRVTKFKRGWFYHKAMHVQLPGGSAGILTARATKPLFGPGRGELVWIFLPQAQNTSLLKEESQGEGCWAEHVLAEGPDVMFEVVDLNPNDDCIEVISAHFFGNCLSVHSIRATSTYPFVEISKAATLDTVGKPYGLCLATMHPSGTTSPQLRKAAVPLPLPLPLPGVHVVVPSNAACQIPSIASPVAESRSSTSADAIPSMAAQSSRTGGDKVKPLTVLNAVPSHARVDTTVPLTHITTTSSSATTTTTAIIEGQPCSHSQGPDVAMEEVDPSNCDNSAPTHLLVTTHECSYDFGATVGMALAALAGRFPRVRTGESSRVRLGERAIAERGAAASTAGGALYAYELPTRPATVTTTTAITPTSMPPVLAHVAGRVPTQGRASDEQGFDEGGADRRLHWPRHALFRGFKVRGWGGIFAPGAPGFPYVFRLPHKPQVGPSTSLEDPCRPCCPCWP